MKTIVVKVGGDLAFAPHVETIATEIAASGDRVILVHGGGPQLDTACLWRGLPIVKVEGRRITSPSVLQAALHAFAVVGTTWVEALQAAGVDAVVVNTSLSAHKRPTLPVDYGQVGDVAGVDLDALPATGVAVVPPLARGPDGWLNVNADTVATELAIALQADELILLTGAPGVLADPDDADSLLSLLDETSEVDIRGGMRPKVDNAFRAVAAGVGKVRIADGRAASPITGSGLGTTIRGLASTACSGSSRQPSPSPVSMPL